MSKNSKLRVLKELEFIKKYSDELNPVSIAEITEMLENEGISADRKAIYDDIQSMIDAGFDIVYTRTPKNGYVLLSREFEVPEVYLLSDAVESAGFISTGKTKELITKLEGLLSKNQADNIKKQVFINNRIKTDNEEIYYVIDAISNAVNACKKIKFLYVKRSFAGKTLVKTQKEMCVSPYAVLWSNDHYYLICNNEKYDNLMHLRIDRIKKIEALKENWRHFSEVSEYKTIFDVADYSKKAANMFGGELKKITLQCNVSIIDQVIDKFGENLNIKEVDDDHFIFDAYALISEGLEGWILQFGSKMKALSPKSLVANIKNTLLELKNFYK